MINTFLCPMMTSAPIFSIAGKPRACLSDVVLFHADLVNNCKVYWLINCDLCVLSIFLSKVAIAFNG